MNLFFVINQHPLDGSAHALYCARNAWWLARTNPNARVWLIYPGRRIRDLFGQFGLGNLENLNAAGLFALRRNKGRKGLTINAVYFGCAYWHLLRNARRGDLFLSASFLKLFAFLAGRKRLREAGAFVYEAHQLGCLDRDGKTARLEAALFPKLDALITTTLPLAEAIDHEFPRTRARAIGLACGFHARDFPPARNRTPAEPFTVAYIGSLYEEQGVDWLVGSWREFGAPDLVLKIAGGGEAHSRRLRALAGGAPNIRFTGRIPVTELPFFLKDVDALVIPSLNRGRMPYVAITKAYDYLALRRPILAADLPSIRDVLRPEREALLFAPENAAALRSNIDRARNSGELRLALANAAAKRAEELSWEERSKRYWEVLHGLASRTSDPDD